MKIYRYTCDQCDLQFPDGKQLKNHQEDNHGPDGPVPKGTKRCICQLCGTQLKNEFILKCHMKAHELPKVKCPKCPNQLFHRENILKDHCMYHHIKIKPFICTTCGAEYWQKLNMGAHIAEAHENWPKDKAKKEWRFLLREKPHLFKQIPLMNHYKRLLGEPIKEDCKT